jgi:hypothetical protein
MIGNLIGSTRISSGEQGTFDHGLEFAWIFAIPETYHYSALESSCS